MKFRSLPIGTPFISFKGDVYTKTGDSEFSPNAEGTEGEPVIFSPDAPIEQVTCSPPPSLEDMEMWDGWAEAMDGCVVEPDGTCPHGCESWLIVLGMI